MKIIWHRISIQTLLFQACLPTRQNGVENRDKAYASLVSDNPWGTTKWALMEKINKTSLILDWLIN